jgi:ferritin-like metal-binding protein YciE
MPMTQPRELFVHELRDIYYVEKQLTKMLPKLAGEATDGELKRGFRQHLRQTERHVKNVEAAFEELGVRASGEDCPGFDGLKQEHDEFMKERPSAAVRDLFLTGAASRTEHYEIAAYTGLVAMARALGEKKVVTLLEKNLADEKEALRKVDTIGRRLGREGAKGEQRSTPRRPASTARRRTAARSTARSRSGTAASRRTTRSASTRSRSRSTSRR